MKILILDDEQDRHNQFNDLLKGNELLHVYDFLTCIEALREKKFDLILLDHDLGNKRTPILKDMGREITGNDIVRFIAEEAPPENKPRRAIVHSTNVPGAQRMVFGLRAVGVPAEHYSFVRIFENSLTKKKFLALTSVTV